MAKTVLGKIGRAALWFSPLVIALAVMVAATPWLMRKSPALAQVLGIGFGIFVLGYALFTGHRMVRGQDEVQKAAAGFASANGWVWGGFVAIAFLTTPPVMNWLIDMVNAMAMPRTSPNITDSRVAAAVAFFSRRAAITMAFEFGATAVMVFQTLAIVVFSVIWQWRMGRSGDAS